MTREALRLACIAALAANDRNGCFTDEDCAIEGFDPMRLIDVADIVYRMADEEQVSIAEMGKRMGMPSELIALMCADCGVMVETAGSLCWECQDAREAEKWIGGAQ